MDDSQDEIDDGPPALGIEIGGTKLQLALGRGDGRLIAARRARVDPARGAEGIKSQIVEEYARLLLDAHVSPGAVQAVGVGFGGPVDASQGRIETSHQISGWTGFPLADWLKNQLRVPRVRIENDADAAGLAEAQFGAGKDRSPLVYVTVGSGIGGALMIDGQIYRGAGRGALEIGHLQIGAADDSPTLEDVASGWAIAKAASFARQSLSRSGLAVWKFQDGMERTSLTALDVVEAARQGEPTCRTILHNAVQAMGQALAHVVTLLAPRRIIIGGGVSLIGEDLWFNPIREVLKTRAFPYFSQQCDIVPAQLGELVVLHGALAVAYTSPP